MDTGERSLLCERRRRRRILDVRAADLQEEMAEQRFSVPSAPTKTAATQRTSPRAERAIQQSAMRERIFNLGTLVPHTSLLRHMHDIAVAKTVGTSIWER
jgi:hypothetical protein